MRKTINLTIPLGSLDQLHDVVSEYMNDLTRHSKKYHSGEVSLGDFSDFDTEVDLEHNVESITAIQKQIESIQYENHRNEIAYLDQFSVFRPEEVIECVRVLKRKTTQIVFILKSRHGVFFLCEDMKNLIEIYTEGKDPSRRFECRVELEAFLYYC